MAYVSLLNYLPQSFTGNIGQILSFFAASLLIVTLSLNWFKNRSRKLPPGPIGLPFFGYLPFLGAEPKRTLQKLSRKYGNIFGLYLGQKYTIIINEFTLAKEAVSHPSALDRAPEIFHHLEPVGFLSANGHEWTEQRRFVMSSSRDLGLGKGPWEAIITDEVQSFINDIRCLRGAPTDISHILSTSVACNIIYLITGRKLNKVNDTHLIRMINEYADTALLYVGPSQVTSVIPGFWKVLRFLRISGYDKAERAIKEFLNFISGEVNRHKTEPELKDVVDLINIYQKKLDEVSEKNEKHYFTEENLKGMLNTIFLGGSDTITSSLNWLLRLMARHQDVQEKVHNEIIEVLGKDGMASFEQRHVIPYTSAVLLEAQRYTSIVPLSTTRKASEDFVINGYTIPKGSDIVNNLWALHNDPNYWVEPEEFRPERFLENNGTKLIKSLPSFAPFSFGRRNCPGENIAWIEILTYFTETVKRFRVTTPPGVKLHFEVLKGIVEHLKPMPLCFTERVLE